MLDIPFIDRFLYCIDNHYWLQQGVNFSAPVLTVMDGFGRKLLDQFYKVGSSLEVMCHVDRLPKRPLPEIIEWRHGDHILSKSNTTLGQRYILLDFYRIVYLWYERLVPCLHYYNQKYDNIFMFLSIDRYSCPKSIKEFMLLPLHFMILRVFKFWGMWTPVLLTGFHEWEIFSNERLFF